MPRTSRTTECDPALSTGYHAPRRNRERTPARTRPHRGPFTMSAHSDNARSIRASPHGHFVQLHIFAIAGVVKSAPMSAGRHEANALRREAGRNRVRKPVLGAAGATWPRTTSGP